MIKPIDPALAARRIAEQPAIEAKRRAAGLCITCSARLTNGECPNKWDGKGPFRVPPRGKHSGPSK